MTEEERLRQTFKAYVSALESGDARACGLAYATDVECVACGMAPVRARDAIVGLHRELLEGGYKLDSMETEEIRISGDLAYVRQTIKSSDGTSIAMLIMRREPNGEWLVHAEAEVSPS